MSLLDTSALVGLPYNPRPHVSDVDSDIAGLNFMRCHQWLEEAYESTNDRNVRHLIDQVMDELWTLGTVEGELGEVVLGALDSVASALEVQTFLDQL